MSKKNPPMYCHVSFQKNTSVIFKSMFHHGTPSHYDKDIYIWQMEKCGSAPCWVCAETTALPVYYECQEKLQGPKAKASFSPKVSLTFDEIFPDHGSWIMDIPDQLILFLHCERVGHLTPQPFWELQFCPVKTPVSPRIDSSPSNIPKSKEDIEWNESSNQTEMERYETPWAHLQSQNSLPWVLPNPVGTMRK